MLTLSENQHVTNFPTNARLKNRIDCEVSGLKQKTVLDVISLCLGNKEDFRSDTIRDALTDLLQDGIPAQALMRTAILSAQV